VGFIKAAVIQPLSRFLKPYRLFIKSALSCLTLPNEPTERYVRDAPKARGGPAVEITLEGFWLEDYPPPQEYHATLQNEVLLSRE
jgi:hypothetical protein